MRIRVMRNSNEVVDKRIDWCAILIMLAMHIAAIAGIVKLGIDWRTGASIWFSLVVMAVTFFGRMFFISAGFHRYFWHQSFKLNQRFLRPLQLAFAFVGTVAVQRGLV